MMKSNQLYTTLFREYNPEICRWKSLDPKLKDFPSESPFSAMGNNPIMNTDVLGDGFNPTGAKIINKSNQPITLSGCSGLTPSGEKTVPDITLNPGDAFIPMGIGFGQSLDVPLIGNTGFGFYFGIILTKDGKIIRTEANDIDKIKVEAGQWFIDDVTDENVSISRNKDVIQGATGKDWKGCIKIGGTVISKIFPYSSTITITIENVKVPLKNSPLKITVTGPIINIDNVTLPKIKMTLTEEEKKEEAKREKEEKERKEKREKNDDTMKNQY